MRDRDSESPSATAPAGPAREQPCSRAPPGGSFPRSRIADSYLEHAVDESERDQCRAEVHGVGPAAERAVGGYRRAREEVGDGGRRGQVVAELVPDGDVGPKRETVRDVEPGVLDAQSIQVGGSRPAILSEC